MTKDYLRECVNSGFEIEFDYKGKQFSITYFRDNGERCISFCEYYQEPVDVKTFDELLNIEYKGERLSDIWESLTEDDIWV